MTELSDRYYVLTYGTLMRGRANYSWMQAAQGEFVDTVVSSTEDYTMFSVHESFPAIMMNGKSRFMGELFAVPAEGILYSLDYLEGYPTFYDRKIISCKGIQSGTEYKALCYIFTPQSAATMGQNLLTYQQSPKIAYKNNCYKWLD